MSFKTWKVVAYVNEEGLRVNGDGTSIIDRKPELKLMTNHYRYIKNIKWVTNNETREK